MHLHSIVKTKSNVIVPMICLLFFYFILFPVFAQEQNEIDDKISNYPSQFQSTEDLTLQIQQDFKSDMEKARAAFAWIAKNVSYNTKEMGEVKKIRFSYTTEKELQEKKNQFRKDLAMQTLHKRKALCEGYSTLFQELCQQMNIECEIVPGTARRFVSEIGIKNLPSNHAWNAVKIEGKWRLVDVTWAAGSIDFDKMIFRKEFSPSYFDVAPKEFALNHFPDNKDWLFIDEPFGLEKFTSQPMGFASYLGKNLQIVSPSTGTLDVKKGKGIAFEISNLPIQTQIAYHLKKEKYGQMIKPTRKKDTCYFSIYPVSKGMDELILYFDNEPALGYKIIVK